MRACALSGEGDPCGGAVRQRPVPICVAGLRRLATSVSQPRPSVEELTLPDGRRVRLLAEGRLVNLGAAEGHPAAVMDMSFANQAPVVERLWTRRGELSPGVHPVPREIDQAVARMKLDALHVSIDALTDAQERYLTSWKEGT